MQEVFEKIKERLETELKCTRDKQTIECMKNDGFGTPLQAKYSGNIEMLLKAIEIVKQVENECLTNGGWIPCSKELPSDGEIHECTVLFNTGMRYIEYAYYDMAREEWWTHDDTGLVNVIAWKSSPQPYRGE